LSGVEVLRRRAGCLLPIRARLRIQGTQVVHDRVEGGREPGGRRSAGIESTAQASEAQAARMARFSARSRSVAKTTSRGS
jgi:hypothetical protein